MTVFLGGRGDSGNLSGSDFKVTIMGNNKSKAEMIIPQILMIFIYVQQKVQTKKTITSIYNYKLLKDNIGAFSFKCLFTYNSDAVV